MAVPTDISLTYSAVGIREDLSNVIYSIAPMDTPFLSGCGKATADNTHFEWQTDTIAGGSANRQKEGEDPDNDARANPVRVGNRTQISRYVIQTSGTNEAVDYAGRKSSQAYQLAKKAKQMKRDMEFMLTSNVPSSAGSASPAAARATGGLSCWIGTNYHSIGTGSPAGAGAVGANGTTAPTDAPATVSITEAGIKQVIKECFDSGGEPDMIMCKSPQKQAISALTQTVSELRTSTKGDAPAHVVAAVDVYVSDFGTFKIVPNRNQFRSRDVFFLDMDYWAVAYLRPFSTQPLAKTGDSVRQMLLAEYGLMSKNEKSSGFLADVADN